jgi:hypothetical protein
MPKLPWVVPGFDIEWPEIAASIPAIDILLSIVEVPTII